MECPGDERMLEPERAARAETCSLAVGTKKVAVSGAWGWGGSQIRLGKAFRSPALESSIQESVFIL